MHRLPVFASGRGFVRHPARAATAVAAALAVGIAGAAAIALDAPASARTVVNGQEVITPTTFSDLADKVGPAVVSVQVAGHGARSQTPDPREMFPPGSPFRDFFDRYFNDRRGDRFGERDGDRNDRMRPRRGPRSMSQGSGFIISADGYVVTNNHVVDEADEVTVVLEDGTELKAKVVGNDERTDLAVLKVDAGRELPHVEWVDGQAEIGQLVMAVGNPFGLGGTVTTGIVSSLGRHIGSGPYDDYIQIDAAVNRGNSGGPTFDLDGKVIGVNTAIYSPNGGNIGISFAIPARIAERVANELIDNGSITRGWLGVSIQNVTKDIADSVGLDKAAGAIVSEVFADAPAKEAGLRSGDVILEVNGKTVEDSRDLALKIADIRPGESAELTVQRDRAERTIEVEIGRMPANPEVAARGDDSQTEEKSTSRLADLGLEVEPNDGEPGARGVLVSSVESGSEADQKGIGRGDIILSVAGSEVTSPQELDEALQAAEDDELSSVLLLVRSNSGQRFVALSLPKA